MSAGKLHSGIFDPDVGNNRSSELPPMGRM
jgi:hypothetical protein